MAETAETIEYRGHTINVNYEEYLEHHNPRGWDNLGTMNCSHRRYTLGDEQDDPSSMTVECEACEGTGELDGVTTESHAAYGERLAECPKCDGAGEIVDPVRWAVEKEGATVVLGLYLYDHSGITMSASTLYKKGEKQEGGNPFHCRWDSGMVGIMYDTPEGRKMCGTPDDLIEECLHGEVKTYDDYLTGQVFWLEVEGPLCNETCGGYFLSHDKPWGQRFDDLFSEGKEWVDHDIEHEAEQAKKIERMMAL